MTQASFEQHHPEKWESFQRCALLGFTALYMFLFVGSFYGWGPMQLMLENNGSFFSKCAPDATEVCSRQTASLLQVHVIATSTQLLSPLLGDIGDRYGGHVIAFMMMGFVTLGLTCLVLAAKFAVDALLYIAFIALALGAWSGGLISVMTGLYFTKQRRSRVIFALNGLFDAGTIAYLGLWSIGESTGASLTELATGYLVLAIMLFSGGLYFWTTAVPVIDEEKCNGDVTETLSSSAGSQNKLEHLQHRSEQVEAASLEELMESSDFPLASEADSEQATEHPECSDVKPAYVAICKRTPYQQLTSKPAILVAFFFGVQVTSSQWTLTTTRDFLGYLDDDDEGNKYLTIFTLLTPASLLAVPMVDFIVGRYGFYGGMQAVNALGLAYNLIRTFSDNLNVQIAGFVLFSFFRCFLFGATLGFLPTLLSTNVVGKATGLLYLIPGVTAFLNIPLTSLAVEKLDGDFFVPNLLYTILMIPCTVAVWFIGRAIELEKKSSS